jgi:dihydrofolate reductase
MASRSARLRRIYVRDGIDSAVRQAQAAAGDKDVLVVGGAGTAQECLRARILDEIQTGGGR